MKLNPIRKRKVLRCHTARTMIANDAPMTDMDATSRARLKKDNDPIILCTKHKRYQAVRGAWGWRGLGSAGRGSTWHAHKRRCGSKRASGYPTRASCITARWYIFEEPDLELEATEPDFFFPPASAGAPGLGGVSRLGEGDPAPTSLQLPVSMDDPSRRDIPVSSAVGGWRFHS